jgi:hypothetical protein
MDGTTYIYPTTFEYPTRICVSDMGEAWIVAN